MLESFVRLKISPHQESRRPGKILLWLMAAAISTAGCEPDESRTGTGSFRSSTNVDSVFGCGFVTPPARALTVGASFSDLRVITTEAYGAQSVFAADLDGDGDMDVLSASKADDTVAWFKNNGSGAFSRQPLITNQANGAFSALAADLDGDGDADVLYAAHHDWNEHEMEIAWYEDQGGGEFTRGGIIASGAFMTTGVFAVDLDSDGDVDVLATVRDPGARSSGWSTQEVVWYENRGKGAFTEKQVITRQIESPERVIAGDLNADGRPDVLVATYSGNKVVWYENRGKGAFTAEQVIARPRQFGGSITVSCADLDGDGDADVLSASDSDEKIVWYENRGGGEFTAERVIATEAESVSSLFAADLDGDGDMDVLAAIVGGGGKIAWYENRGGGEFTAERVITTEVRSPESVFAADLDGDGDMDVLSASSVDDKIAWYENRGRSGGQRP